MNQKHELTHTVEGRVMTLTRTFDAPRGLVFAAFTSCEHLQHWWGPQGWSLPVCEMDFRPGGKWFYCMAGPDDAQSCGLMTYHEIVAPERIVSTDQFADAGGNPNPNLPVMLNTISFNEEGGKTLLINRVQYATEAELATILEMGALEGITETFERLEAYLARLQAP